jgi:hypothetical protein
MRLFSSAADVPGLAFMFHSNTELLIDRWHAQALPGAVPARAELDLAPFARIAAQLFVVGRQPAGRYPFRLAGEFVRELHGRRLKGEDAMHLFNLSGRIDLRPALEASRRGRTTLTAVVNGRTLAGETLGLELTFAPMSGPGGGIDRFLGLYQPTTPVALLRGEAIRELALLSLHAGETDTPRLRLAALDGRRIA